MAIAYLQTLKDSIENLSKWESTGEAFGFIDSVADPNPDYIYEFYCAMRILNDLNFNHKIEICEGTDGYVFPQNPGLKSKFAKFIIKDKNTKKPLFQFCLGVNIRISNSSPTTFGADISIQKPLAKDDPDESDVVLIMDAKYKKSGNTKLDISIIREFAQCVMDMEVPKGMRRNLQFKELNNLKANCLLTNGKGNSKHQLYCKNKKIKQVGNFDWDSRTIDITIIG